jgi:hypothetical protein
MRCPISGKRKRKEQRSLGYFFGFYDLGSFASIGNEWPFVLLLSWCWPLETRRGRPSKKGNVRSYKNILLVSFCDCCEGETVVRNEHLFMIGLAKGREWNWEKFSIPEGRMQRPSARAVRLTVTVTVTVWFCISSCGTKGWNFEEILKCMLVYFWKSFAD